MTENLLLPLSIKQLYDLADSAINLYVVARINSNQKDLADMREVDLALINRVIIYKLVNELN
jgi:hypothetical protein